MRRAHIDADGRLDLGDQARRAGYQPGAVVDVILTRAGSIILALADDHDTIDIASRRLPAGMARRAITGGPTR